MFGKPPKNPLDTRPSRATGTMQQWGTWVGGLTRYEKDQLYPGMLTDLIPAYEMITGGDPNWGMEEQKSAQPIDEINTWGQPVDTSTWGQPVDTATWGQPTTLAVQTDTWRQPVNDTPNTGGYQPANSYLSPTVPDTSLTALPWQPYSPPAPWSPAPTSTSLWSPAPSSSSLTGLPDLPGTSALPLPTYTSPYAMPSLFGSPQQGSTGTKSDSIWDNPATEIPLLDNTDLGIMGLAGASFGASMQAPSGYDTSNAMQTLLASQVVQSLGVASPYNPPATPPQPARRPGILGKSLVKPAAQQNPWTDNISNSVDAITGAAANVMDMFGNTEASEANSKTNLLSRFADDNVIAGTTIATTYEPLTGTADQVAHRVAARTTTAEDSENENDIIVDPYDVMALMNSFITELHHATFEDNKERGVVIDYAVGGNGKITLTPSAVVTGDSAGVLLAPLVSEKSVGAMHTHPRKGYVGDMYVNRGPSSTDLNLADRWDQLNGAGQPFVLYVLEVDNKMLYSYQANRPGIVKRRYYT